MFAALFQELTVAYNPVLIYVRFMQKNTFVFFLNNCVYTIIKLLAFTTFTKD